MMEVFEAKVAGHKRFSLRSRRKKRAAYPTARFCQAPALVLDLSYTPGEYALVRGNPLYLYERRLHRIDASSHRVDCAAHVQRHRPIDARVGRDVIIPAERLR